MTRGFNKPLVVVKMKNGGWKTKEWFEYFTGNKDESVLIPENFETDFASVPRIFWTILPPDGKYSQAAVLHDFLYQKQIYSRKESDQMFVDAMQVLGVARWKQVVMYRALRMFGWWAWSNGDKKKKT